ncbi:MAG TPA: response regulator, partial [Acidimicrobiales bacterium]|nr:response regulator [Acidimicrobiales bacterium]
MTTLAEPSAPRARPVIVAVDDDPLVLNSVRGDLRGRYGRDYRIIVADGGQAAIDSLRELKVRGEPVALVISDQRMPDVSGFEVLEAAKE